MITIIDYGMANLGSVLKAFEAVGAQARISGRPEDLGESSHVVLPGVGAFGDTMKNLDSLGFTPVIKSEIAKGKPYLGICLGYQILF